MTFVEFLRVRRALLVYSIILTAIVVLTLIVTLSAHAGVGSDVGRHGASVQVPLRQALADDFARHGTKVPLSVLVFVAGFGAMILASIFGCYLCGERDHTPLAWTKPASRERFALAYLGVDVLGTIAAFFITLAATLLVLSELGIVGFLSVDRLTGTVLLLVGGMAFAYYGVVRALTVGFPGRGGAITGASWGIFYVAVGLTALPLPPVYHAIVVALNFLNPLAYLTNFNDSALLSSVVPLDVTARIACVWLLAVASSALAIIIYRRAEA